MVVIKEMYLFLQYHKWPLDNFESKAERSYIIQIPNDTFTYLLCKSSFAIYESFVWQHRSEKPHRNYSVNVNMLNYN